MHRIRFGLIGVVSFIITIIATTFISGSFLNRLIIGAFCTFLSFNYDFCNTNLWLGSNRVMATNTVLLERTRDIYSDSPQQEESVNIEKQRNSILAFKADEEGYGHRAITYAAIDGDNFIDENNSTYESKNKFRSPKYTPEGTWLPIGVKSKPNLHFTHDAREEIYQANRAVDLKPNSKYINYPWENGSLSPLPFSEEFDKPINHFDNESFPEGSLRLIHLRRMIYRILDPITTANKSQEQGKEARRLLGGALHTLQDFYAHSNWVELGKKEINKDLGRKLLCGIPPTSEIEDINDIKNINVSVDTPCSRRTDESRGIAGDPTSIKEKKVTGSPHLGTVHDEWQYDPGTLDRNLNKLTSGYFLGLSPTSYCNAPKGKTRHGGPGCSSGLNKDEPDDHRRYSEASKLAVDASQDYIHQILDPLAESGKFEAIKAFMGIKEDPCKSENNQTPSECKQKQGISTNDPHLVTFDGLRYDLQTVGEFILAQSNDGAFNLQVRQTPFNNSASVSINSAVAIKVGSDRVAFYAQHFPDTDTSTPLRVNGKPTKIQGDKLVLKGGEILKQGSTYVISSLTGEKVLVSPSGAGNNAFFNVSSFVYNRSGKYSGLLGNVNGKPNDDQQIRGGGNVLKVQSTYGDVNKVLNQVGLRLPGALSRGEKVYFDQLYKEFANSWRVKQEESLFDYPAGKTTKNYLDPSFPEQYLKLDMLSPEQIQNARNACTKAKVSQDLMEGCIFDVGFSGVSEFARATAEINGYVNIVNQLFPSLKIPTTRQVGDRVIQKVKPKKVCALGICL